ncbi:DUF1381 domain-containing protein [Staphylococcus hominis]|uniref:DUF1381 domain-containing protein n=1 Tax=Staphylococcus hominis TaxID=1290 RepID=UPI00287B3DFA|nr:DUF1381 domain-containing protein [Staphylococcus hominis]MDS3918698.1 DUF1381 domain-containing protein [Staphylococcus hominis]
MTQYLIRQFEDSTGYIHTDIEKARTNETLYIVEAEDKEEAFYKHRYNEQLEFLLKYAVNIKKTGKENLDND